MAVRQQVRSPGRASPTSAAPALSIPYDHAVPFRLTGVPGRVVEGVITTDTDGVFVAESIGYGFEAQRAREVTLRRIPNNIFTDITLSDIPRRALLTGFRIRPSALADVFPDPLADSVDGPPRRLVFNPTVRIPTANRNTLLETLDGGSDAPFLLSMIDTATGRELQDEPTHSVASLGSANGVRPFRRFAQPISFQPRSTFRLQVTELATDVAGTLFIVLQGYKILSATSCSAASLATVSAMQSLQRDGVAQGRLVPFDYVAAVDLRGEPARRETVEVPINTEGGFVASSIGYGLQPPEQNVLLDIDLTAPFVNTTNLTLDLKDLNLGCIPPDALVDGVRVRTEIVRLVFRNDGALSNAFDLNLTPVLFERLNRPEDVSFRYEIHDTGTGRHLQNRPIHNIAGLGSADGKRPFRKLARPLIMLPRSALRVTVEERSGRGRLFLVFHGFKVISAGRL